MINKPLISCIVTAYNSESTVLETLNSIQNQTYQNWECIVVDDASKDRTVELVKKNVLNDNRFKIITNEINSGKQAKMLNQGITNSRGEYFLFIDSDDLIPSDCLAKRVSSFDADCDFMVFPNVKRFTNRVDEKMEISYEYDYSKNNYLYDFIIHTYPTPWQITSVLWKRESIEKLEGFNEKYKRMVDVELSTRALILGLKYKINEIEKDKIDFYYRTTENENLIKTKRQNFYFASMVYMEEIRTFTLQNTPYQLPVISKYLYYFFLSMLSMTLVSKQFSHNEAKLLIDCVENNNIISHKKADLFRTLFANRTVNKISKLFVIRTVIFRSVNFIINIRR